MIHKKPREKKSTFLIYPFLPYSASGEFVNAGYSSAIMAWTD
jgi:hypothetical protein